MSLSEVVDLSRWRMTCSKLFFSIKLHDKSIKADEQYANYVLWQVCTDMFKEIESICIRLRDALAIWLGGGQFIGGSTYVRISQLPLSIHLETFHLSGCRRMTVCTPDKFEGHPPSSWSQRLQQWLILLCPRRLLSILMERFIALIGSKIRSQSEWREMGGIDCVNT